MAKTSPSKLFQIEHDPKVESSPMRGKNRHLVDDLVNSMEKMEVGNGHIKLPASKFTDKEAISLFVGAKRVFIANPKNKHTFSTRMHYNGSGEFLFMAILRRA